MTRQSILLALLLASGSSAFTPMSHSRMSSTTSLASSLSADLDFEGIKKKLNYKPAAADTEFARRFGHLKGANVKTVGEAFAEFTAELGFTVNPLYKNMVTDLVGTTHLIVVNARFQRDPLWSLGILTAMDLLLKNYPEKDVGAKIVSSLFKCIGMDETEIRAEALVMSQWATGKTREEMENALQGNGDGPLADIARKVKADEYWMYSRYFGIGLLRLMEMSGMAMDKDDVYPVMESWMSEKLGRSHLTACSDSDLFFKIKSKLDMMETMMKEIEIREKKRMAERLEEKAEAALRAAEKEKVMQAEIEAEAARNRERVES